MSQSRHSGPTNAPRFRQIVDVLRQRIDSGELVEHAALPSERVVAEQHDVSRMTARRALEAIEAEGLAYSENRRGRFVSPKRLKYNINGMVSFAADAEENGASLDIEVIEAAEIRADAYLAKQLDVAINEPLHEYTRLFRIDDHPIFVETERVVARRCTDLLQQDLRQSTTKLLEQHYQIHAGVGDVTIRMTAMRPQEADLLGASPNHVGIELEQVIRDTKGVAFCAGRQMWRGELAEFSARAIVGAAG